MFPFLCGQDSPPSLSSLPFALGERLEYELKWGFFPVGTATMKVTAVDPVNPDGHKLIRFHVRTNSFADAFYKVRTTITSTLDSSFSRTLKYKKSQHEGSTLKEIEVEFDYEKKQARYKKQGSEPRIIPIPGPVFDPLSIAYVFRLHPLVPGGVTRLPVCDGKRFSEVAVRAGVSEIINLPLGEISAIETYPAMGSLRGVFNKSPKGMLKVWFSDDYRKVPVCISSKVIVGSFKATLTDVYPTLQKEELSD